METLRLVGSLGLGASALGAVLFTVLFGTTVRWRSDSLGWLIMSFALVVSTILGYSSAQLIWPDMPWRFEVRAVLFPVLAVIFWTSVGVFIRSQILDRRARRKLDPPARREPY